jgi:hypothetical protein
MLFQKLSYNTINTNYKYFWASQGHRQPQNFKLSFISFVIFVTIFVKMVTFNRDSLQEGKRYLRFPVDFLKAQTIAFHESCNYFHPILLHLGVKSLQNNEGLRS